MKNLVKSAITVSTYRSSFFKSRLLPVFRQRQFLLPLCLAVLLLFAAHVSAHELTFNSTVMYSDSQLTDGTDNISNWMGAAFDADNIGGSGVNADGGSDNGPANDASTYVANNQPRQGQTFTTGSNPDGYQLTAVTARMVGYTNNNATGDNRPAWDLNAHNGPIQVEIGKVSGTDVQTLTKQMFIMGGNGNPGNGASTNGAGTYITFQLPFTTYLEPNTTYSFDFWVGNGSNNYFEWLGTQNDEYAGGTAYTREWWGGPITPRTGERVFQLELTALDAPAPSFVHPGTLHTQADLDRMAAKVASNEEPWLSGWNMLLSSPYNNLGWPAYNVDYIIRGGTGDNYTRCQQDAQLIYTQALIWHITGNTAYANRAVEIANVWSDLIGLQGDTNRSLAAGICGYLFAISGDLLSTYPGWLEADKQAYKDMMMRVFYPENLDFLWRHHDTPFNYGGNTHYRLNWDSANMASMAAIGVLCDNRAVYKQAVDYFKDGPGNGNIRRAAWYIHPDGMAQTEEIGRDQGHNMIGWYQMALLCQIGYNQGDDLFAYDNNRVLRAVEHSTKYNLGYAVPAVGHRNTSLGWTEYLWGCCGLHYFHELIYNHYVNIKGMRAPYNEEAAAIGRPERWPDTANHPSEVDWLGNGTLTFTRDPIAGNPAPSGLQAHWSGGQVNLIWMGAPYATGYNIKRSMTPGGPYTAIGTAGDMDLAYADTTVSDGNTYYYVVSANTPSSETTNSEELMVSQRLVAHYPFEGNANDMGGRDGVVYFGGSSEVYGTGHDGGQAIDLDGYNDYVQLPKGIANYQDVTVAAWVNWDGGNAMQRIFDFGTEIEKNMYMTPSTGSNMRFKITTTRGNEGTGAVEVPILPTGQWKHVAVTLNGNTGTIYVDGAPVGSAVIDGVDPLFGQPFCYLGRSMWNNDPHFNGRIDDFRIYNYALSSSEISDLYNGVFTNYPPMFDSNPFTKPNAIEGSTYTGQTLSDDAHDVNGDTMTFSKVSGPSWLSVASNGALSGTPGAGDVGLNSFIVEVTDNISGSHQATLEITVSTLPSAPTGLTAAGVSLSQIDLSWNASSVDTWSYNVKRSTVSGGPYTIVAGPTDTSFSDTGLADGTTYYYVVSAVNAAGEGPDSTEASAVTYIRIVGSTAGSEETGNWKENSYDGYPATRWCNDGTVTNAWIQYDLGSTYNVNEVHLLLHKGTTRTYPIQIEVDGVEVFNGSTTMGSGYWTTSFDPTDGRYVKIAMTDVNSDGSGWFSINETEILCSSLAPPDTTPPAAPTGLGATAGDGSVSLDWADNTEPDLASYAVYRSTTSGSGYISIASDIVSSDYVDNSVTNGTTYYYIVTAVDTSSNESDNSNEDSATPQAVNGAPTFNSDPINEANATEDVAYSSTLADNASDPESDPMTFSKVSGPAWLTVVANGDLSGTPSNGDVGLNVFTVQVDATGGSDTATLNITVDEAICDPTLITPYLQIDGGAWQQASDATLNEGQTIKYGPQPVSGGSWSWSGPNGYSASTREITLSNVTTADAGAYVATYTNDCGAQSQQTFNLTVNVAGGIVFSDSFENGEWNGLWTEDSQNDWFASTQRYVDGSYSAEVDGSANDATLTSILIDLQGNSNATVTFSWLIESGFDSGEYLAFDVSINGGSNWTQLAVLQGNIDQEDTWHNESIDVTGIASGNLMIRFRCDVSRSNEDADVDMVEVLAW